MDGSGPGFDQAWRRLEAARQASEGDLLVAAVPPLERLRGPEALQAAAEVEEMARALHPSFAPLASALLDAATFAREGDLPYLDALLVELSGWDVGDALRESRALDQAEGARERLEAAACEASPGPLVGAVFEGIQLGDLRGLEAMLGRELARAEMTLLSYEDALLLEPDQWTATAAVADEALCAGLVAWIEALETLLAHCQRGDLDAVERELPLLEEADRQLAAVASLGKGCST